MQNQIVLMLLNTNWEKKHEMRTVDLNFQVSKKEIHATNEQEQKYLRKLGTIYFYYWVLSYLMYSNEKRKTTKKSRKRNGQRELKEKIRILTASNKTSMNGIC